MRRLLIVASIVVFFDVAFYAAIVPLLPGYVDDLGLSKAQAGILSASYAVGTLLAALPAGLVAARVGPRRTMLAGLALLAVSSLAFGFAHHIAALDAARFAQGVSGALTWSGAFTWLVSTAPEERRGSVIGTALGAAVAGALLGPALGALAHRIGTEPVFGSVMVVALGLAILAARIPDATTREDESLHHVLATIATPAVIASALLMAVPSMTFGAVNVIVPLRLDELGGSVGLIAASFIAGAGLEAILAPVVGSYSDRVGRLAPYLAGLVVCGVAMVVVALAGSIPIVAAAVVAFAVGAGLCYSPATAMLADSAEAVGLHQGFAAGLSNMAWAGGQVLGGIGAGAGAGLFGFAAPCLTVAAILAITAVLVRRSMPALLAPPVPASE